jgi:pimeloyl-ACP methyl ester carboxylesterase
MGGYVALEIARRAPERVLRLALLQTNARPDTAESTANRRRLMDLAEKDFPAVVEALLARIVTAEHAADSDITGTISEMAIGIGKEAFLRQQTAIIGRIDSRPHLAAIRCPTLVMHASEDQLMSLEMMQEVASAIPGARFEIVENSGHMATLEQPEQAARLLGSWLDN